MTRKSLFSLFYAVVILLSAAASSHAVPQHFPGGGPFSVDLPEGFTGDPYRRTMCVQSVALNGGTSLAQFPEGIWALNISANPTTEITGNRMVYRLKTGINLGNQSAVYSSDKLVTAYSLKPYLSGLISTGASSTNQRLWFGLSSNRNVFQSDTQDWGGYPAGYHKALVRYSTVAGDTTFKCLVGNATGYTLVDSGVAFSPNTQYKIDIDMQDPSKIDFYFDDVLKASITTNLPGSSEGLNCLLGLATQEAAMKSVGFSKIWLESN